MSATIIPTDTSTATAPRYSQVTTLDGVPFVLTFELNQRAACWYLSVSNTDGKVLVAGVKIVCGVRLLRRFVTAGLPAGDLVAVSSSSDESPPGQNELGSGRRVVLFYVPAADLPA